MIFAPPAAHPFPASWFVALIGAVELFGGRSDLCRVRVPEWGLTASQSPDVALGMG
jgi:hypothetical protein